MSHKSKQKSTHYIIVNSGNLLNSQQHIEFSKMEVKIMINNKKKTDFYVKR